MLVRPLRPLRQGGYGFAAAPPTLTACFIAARLGWWALCRCLASTGARCSAGAVLRMRFASAERGQRPPCLCWRRASSVSASAGACSAVGSPALASAW